MTCAIRVSRKFLNCIDEFATKNKTLQIDEVLYLTLALHNNLSIINPEELRPIVYRQDFNNVDRISNFIYWKYDDIKSNYLYHPIKNFNVQNDIRKKNNFIQPLNFKMKHLYYNTINSIVYYFLYFISLVQKILLIYLHDQNN